MFLAFNPIALNALVSSIMMRRASVRDSAEGLVKSPEIPLSIISFIGGILKAKIGLPQAIASISTKPNASTKLGCTSNKVAFRSPESVQQKLLIYSSHIFLLGN